MNSIKHRHACTREAFRRLMSFITPIYKRFPFFLALIFICVNIQNNVELSSLRLPLLAKKAEPLIERFQRFRAYDDPQVEPMERKKMAIRPYTTEGLAKQFSYMSEKVSGQLLLYNPCNDTFLTFAGAPSNNRVSRIHTSAPRYRFDVILPILIHSLKRLRPHRFQPNQPPFQLFFTETDFTYLKCGAGQGTTPACPEDMVPWIHFGSFFRNVSFLLPSLHVKPHSFYLKCMREFLLNPNISECTTWKLPYRPDAVWENLIPKVIWRGGNFGLLESLTDEEFYQGKYSVPSLPFRPRKLAVDWTVSGNESSWLDAAFPRKRLDEEGHALYRYHIDLGGWGGTSWTGTLDKLAYPGLLLHHETPAQDWFYSEMVPWKHYVPVRTDLSNLKKRYEWAEANPELAHNISLQGIKFVHDMFSARRLRYEYERHFGEGSTLGAVIDAYQPMFINETVDAILADYTRFGVFYLQNSICSREYCDSWTGDQGLWERHYMEQDKRITLGKAESILSGLSFCASKTWRT